MDIGKPVPPNLETMSIPQLHGIMEDYNAEIEAVVAKQKAVKPTLDALHMAKKLSNRAGFDTVIGMGKPKMTIADARALIQRIAEGTYEAPGVVLDALKEFVAGGKD